MSDMKLILENWKKFNLSEDIRTQAAANDLKQFVAKLNKKYGEEFVKPALAQLGGSGGAEKVSPQKEKNPTAVADALKEFIGKLNKEHGAELVSPILSIRVLRGKIPPRTKNTKVHGVHQALQKFIRELIKKHGEKLVSLALLPDALGLEQNVYGSNTPEANKMLNKADAGTGPVRKSTRTTNSKGETVMVPEKP